MAGFGSLCGDAGNGGELAVVTQPRHRSPNSLWCTTQHSLWRCG